MTDTATRERIHATRGATAAEKVGAVLAGLRRNPESVVWLDITKRGIGLAPGEQRSAHVGDVVWCAKLKEPALVVSTRPGIGNGGRVVITADGTVSSTSHQPNLAQVAGETVRCAVPEEWKTLAKTWADKNRADTLTKYGEAMAKKKTGAALRAAMTAPPPAPTPPPAPVSPFVGLTIVAVRPMTAAEARVEGWRLSPHHGPPMVLVLSEGFLIYPSQDDEGNGPGALFGTDVEGQTLRVL